MENVSAVTDNKRVDGWMDKWINKWVDRYMYG